jgi:asparagine synthase (glutamine-hydrolysing)
MRRYQQVLSIIPGDQIDTLFQPGVLDQDAGDAILRSWEDFPGLMSETDELGGLQFLEVRSTLPDELLMYADKLSMAHSLELRVPFLDKEIVEYVERLPARFKVRHGSQKWSHRQVCKNFLPAEIMNRPKRGFAVNVVDGWFRDAVDGSMTDTLRDSGSQIYRFLQPKSVQQLFEQHVAGRQDNHKILFSLVLLEEWLRAHALAPAKVLS